MRWQTALKLGRVSNLPTVWSNILAGMVLAGQPFAPWQTVAILLLACSLMYVGGMFLNDAFDAEIDARERAERPIPQGEVSRNTVFVGGFALLALGVLPLFSFSFRTAVAGLCLAGAIVLYDWYHKSNPLSPVVMGVCRMLVYAVAGFAVVAKPNIMLVWGALALLLYLIGLTYVAKQENMTELRNLWPLACLAAPFVLVLVHIESMTQVFMLGVFAGWTVFALTFLAREGRNVPRTVISLIAGMSLLDASFIMMMGVTGPAILAIFCFVATLMGQKAVSGT